MTQIEKYLVSSAAFSPLPPRSGLITAYEPLRNSLMRHQVRKSPSNMGSPNCSHRAALNLTTVAFHASLHSQS